MNLNTSTVKLTKTINKSPFDLWNIPLYFTNLLSETWLPVRWRPVPCWSLSWPSSPGRTPTAPTWTRLRSSSLCTRSGRTGTWSTKQRNYLIVHCAHLLVEPEPNSPNTGTRFGRTGTWSTKQRYYLLVHCVLVLVNWNMINKTKELS